MLYLIDRRQSPRGKSAVNRERFLRRYKEHIRRAVQRMVAKRSITDMVNGGEVSIPARDINEPAFRHGAGGDREIVAPGNREFAKGDKLRRPDGGAGGGGTGASGGGDSVDEFTFSLSRDEFLNIFFEDLELPRLARTVMGKVDRFKLERAGYTTEGAPCNLSVIRTLQSALGRRVALSGALNSRMEELRAEADSEEADEARRAEVEAELEALGVRRTRVPFLDPLDLRYRNRTLKPMPVARAVMFCLMDVSASMDENKKDLAKRFFTLLYLFLTQKYEHVDLVFVRHTEHAEEVDENTFFNDPGSGGTVVLSALEMMHKIVTERYPASSWNIYAAQASDGDAFGADGGGSARFLEESILPLTRYYAYVEVPDSTEARASALWTAYDAITHDGRFAMRRVTQREEIYPVFRELFRKEA
jgi:uncharacterized sporulation protein YeaH/YhbH (DUF444 family)